MLRDYQEQGGPLLGKQPSEETRRKISTANTGKHHSEETKKKISIALTGRHRGPPSEETKIKLRNALRGRPLSKEAIEKRRITHAHIRPSEDCLKKAWEATRGTHLSEEHKHKISETLKGRICSAETRKKLSAARKGRKFSKEWKKNISLARIGRKFPSHLSEEARNKISERLKGHKLSELTRKKIGDAIRGHKHTKKHRERISRLLRGIFISDEHRRKISEALKKYYIPEERRERLRTVRANMPDRDTKPEITVQKYLYDIGVKYENHKNIADLLIGTPYSNHQFDIVIEPLHMIIEVQGCYWHSCPIHFPRPTPKLLQKRIKDGVIQNFVEGAGWKMIWIWEHDIKTGIFKKQLDDALGIIADNG